MACRAVNGFFPLCVAPSHTTNDGKTVCTFTPGATAGFGVPSVEYAGWSQDERNANAVELMAEAGYGADNPIDLTLLYNTSEAHKKVALAASQMWKQNLGVNATLEIQEWKTYLTTRGEQNYEVARAG
ncbi:ABC transporter substrate-binding protein [Aliiroseovarius sp. PrR006]|uniref:ABC transporter substrate-binding protein n=1 Tax=Aliiroseovarius sp. PrR006 TaxID=2706883 RepID=UPI001EF32806|nr:ABC transporter substrate-binding protein [Aliiroseovarius sp. PrR006]